MNGILGFAQLLEFSPKDPLTQQQTEYVDLILQAGNHLLGLINEVLDLSKIESGNLTLSVETIDPLAAVQECVNLISPLAEQRRIRLIDQISARPEAPLIRADFVRFKQILVNLASNAVKYNREGGTVTLSCDCQENRGGRIRFEVTDTGTGIPEIKLHELFEPFNRLGQEAGEIEGSGIGLTITRMLVELMNGRIGVDSTVGEGSTFWIDLPLATAEQVRDSHAAAEQAARAEEMLVVEGLHTILYVEDNPNNLKLMEKLLSRFPDVTMLSAPNAEEGIEIAREVRPDVILLDINLPGMDGFAALRQLLIFEETRDIPVLALSASAMPRNIKRGLKAGFQTYLTKPIDITKTVRAINVALGSRSVDRAASAAE